MTMQYICYKGTSAFAAVGLVVRQTNSEKKNNLIQSFSYIGTGLSRLNQYLILLFTSHPQSSSYIGTGLPWLN